MAGVLGGIIALVGLNFATYRYAASYKVTPARQDQGSMPAGLGNLAAAAGVSLGRGDNAKPFTLYLQLLKSRDVADELARNPRILRGAFPSSWDPVARKWRQPPSRTRWLKNGIKALAGAPLPPWQPPGAEQLQEWLDDNISVSDDQRNAIATIRLLDEDPAFARLLLSEADRIADRHLRERAWARSTAAITYLQRLLPMVTLAEHRAALAFNLGEQERVRMMTQANTAFAAERLGEVTVTSVPVSPNPLLTVAGSGLAALLIGLGLALYLPERRSY